MASVGFPGSVPAHPDPVSWPEGARAKALFAIEHAHYYIVQISCFRSS